ncbi:CRISPR-associated endonuclease Cas1 [Pseudonocardia sp. Cha107L01]|uniref:CRISPR-associated endonuclease Cas1 n=1 Tax=Pseudonocardia sp. Cha107L01 TaxID=3457576 RepID=UPI00403EA73F
MPDKTTSATATVYNRVSGDPRVLVADGYGVTLRVQRGHLSIEDGIGQHRRTRILPRIERTVRRIIVLANTGYLSWDAARWCTDVGITVVQVDQTGRLVTITGAPEPDDARLRRAQAFAAEGGPNAGTGLDIIKYVLARKLNGQADIADRLLSNHAAATAIRDHARQIADSATVQAASGQEGPAAALYWKAWIGRVIVPFIPREASDVPAHWTTFVVRSSPIDTASGNARHAADPINALLNYAYRLAEIECRLACLTVGLDPAMGFLHADAQNRDSLALDLMEILRPDVDRFVLELLSNNSPMRYVSAKLFAESRDGGCRLVPPITHLIAEQSLAWARLIAPHVEHVARMLANLGRGEIRPARPLTTNKTIIGSAKTTTAKPLRLPGPVTVERIIPDELWDTLAPMLPPNRVHRRGGRAFRDNRTVLAGIVCVELLGCSWAKIPPTLDISRYTCKSRLDVWRTDGAWAAVRRVLNTSDHIRELATTASSTPAAVLQ